VILLTFAHGGEASRFLKTRDVKTLDFPVPGLYRADNAFLLITGEGLQNATEKVSAVCGAFHKEIKSVVNLGIAGALDDSVSVGEIYPVRVCYCERDGSMVFKSFPSASFEEARARDCVSVSYRALDPDSGARLENFAPLVDREAWAIASVCSLFNLPFRSYKLVSDRLGEQTTDLFESARSQARQYSERLYDYFKSQKESPEKRGDISTVILGEDFYFTTSQKKRYRALIESLSIKFGNEEAVWKRIDLQKITTTNSSPKARTGDLLRALSDLLNPINSAIQHRLSDLTKPLTDAGWSVQFAEDYQNDSINLSARVPSAESLRRLKAALETVSIDDIREVLNGKIDV
jgi:hypothetical protein